MGNFFSTILIYTAQDQTTLPVRVSGGVKQGFKAEFTPTEVGAHTIVVNYNDYTVSGTPFTCKVYDASKVGVSQLPRGAIGKNLQFIGKKNKIVRAGRFYFQRIKFLDTLLFV